jgi:hypothetical protein
MLRALRNRLAGGPAEADADELLAEVTRLTDLNRRDRSPDRERELLRLRQRAAAALIAAAEEPPARPANEVALDEDGLASIGRSDLNAARVRGAILGHGYALVRGLLDRNEALSFADEIERVFRARSSEGEEGGLYEEYRPAPPYPQIAKRVRAWIEAGSGVLAADSPRLMFEMLELLDRSGLRSLVRDYLDEPVLVSVQKCTLRKADPGPPGGWHQDGSFMGRTRALNVWIALSDCGEDAPGLDFVPRRIGDLVETIGIGAEAELAKPARERKPSPGTTLVAHETAEAAADGAEIVRPLFRAGDAMLFDDLFLHRTGSNAEMPDPRYAIESWFFGASGFPRDYVPLAA